ncbi:MAG: TetR/AcrR family transcriptional regulator [Pseudomonadota bacterium]
MPRPALTDAQRRETRRQIRQAAAQLYTEKGITDISARSVAKAAGVSVGTIYTHFENLTELMQSLWKAPFARLLRELEEMAASIDDPKERLRALLEAYIQFAKEQPGVYRGAFMFVRPESLEKPPRLPLEDNPFFSLMRDAIQAGQNQGQFQAGDPNTQTQLLWAGIHGSITLPANIDRLAFAPAEELSSGMIDLLLAWLST